MRLTPHLVSFGLLLAATGVASAKPAYVTSTVNLRAAPGTTSEVLTKIPGGSAVDAGECSEGWCAVTYQGKAGFAIETALDLGGQRPPVQRSARTRYYTNDPGYIEGPDVYYDAPPPVYYAPGPYYYGGYGYYGPYYRRGWRRW